MNGIGIKIILLVWACCSSFCYGHGSVHQVIQGLDAKLAQHPDKAELYLQRAEFLLKDGNSRAARKDLEQVARLAPRMEKRLLLSAMVHASEKRFNAAESELGEYIRLRPNDAQGYVVRSQLMEKLGKRKQAEADVKAAIRRHRAPLPLFHKLIQLQLRRKAFADVLKTYDQAEKTLGTVPALLASKATTLAKYGKPAEAAKVYARLRKLNPALGFSWWYEEGMMWRSVKKGQAQAKYAFQQAVATWPRMPKRTRSLYHMKKKYRKALKYMKG